MGLDTVELVMTYEEAFDVRISDAAAEKLVTPRRTCDLIEHLLKNDNRPMPRQDIERMVEEVTLEFTGIESSIYHLDAKYIEDFGLD